MQLLYGKRRDLLDLGKATADPTAAMGRTSCVASGLIIAEPENWLWGIMWMARIAFHQKSSIPNFYVISFFSLTSPTWNDTFKISSSIPIRIVQYKEIRTFRLTDIEDKESESLPFGWKRVEKWLTFFDTVPELRWNMTSNGIVLFRVSRHFLKWFANPLFLNVCSITKHSDSTEFGYVTAFCYHLGIHYPDSQNLVVRRCENESSYK
jgi:hypothetical protein